jgi:hypothetical protein
MQDSSPQTGSTHRLERLLAVLAAAVCVLVCALIWQVVSAQQDMWPLPALYLLEMVAASLLGLWDTWSNETRPAPYGGMVTWVATGILLAFVILGAWSVGFLYIPVAVLLAAAAVLSDRRQGRSLALHMGVGLGAAFAQAVLMLGVIGLL